MAGKRTLDLRTALVPERDVVNLDGATYELRDFDELSLSDHIRVERVGEKFAAFASSITSSDLPPDDPGLEALIREVVRRIVIDLPEDVEARLSWRARLQVLDFFWMGVVEKKTAPGAVKAAAKARSSRSSSSSRGSSASTGATPSGGSESLSASS